MKKDSKVWVYIEIWNIEFKLINQFILYCLTDYLHIVFHVHFIKNTGAICADSFYTQRKFVWVFLKNLFQSFVNNRMIINEKYFIIYTLHFHLGQ